MRYIVFGKNGGEEEKLGAGGIIECSDDAEYAILIGKEWDNWHVYDTYLGEVVAYGGGPYYISNPHVIIVVQEILELVSLEDVVDDVFNDFQPTMDHVESFVNEYVWTAHKEYVLPSRLKMEWSNVDPFLRTSARMWLRKQCSGR